jgi:hypothetical protein
LVECFDRFFIEVFGLDAFDEIFKAFEFSSALPFFNDFFGADRTDILDRLETETDAFDIIVTSDDRETLKTFIDIWLENTEADFARFTYFNSDSIGIILVAREECSHEFGWIMGFEVGGLITDHRIAGRMGTIETIAGERFDEGEDLFGDVFGDSMFDAAFDEFDPLFRDQFFDFFPTALRSTSASPSEKPARSRAICISCS